MLLRGSSVSKFTKPIVIALRGEIVNDLSPQFMDGDQDNKTLGQTIDKTLGAKINKTLGGWNV